MGGDLKYMSLPRNKSYGASAVFLGAIALLKGGPRADGQVSVTTYHYDNHRTGWNPAETVLTPAVGNSTAFRFVYSYQHSIDQVHTATSRYPGGV